VKAAKRHPAQPHHFRNALDITLKLVDVTSSNYRVPTFVGLITAGFLALSACGSSSVTPTAADTAPATAGAEANTGEAIPVAYADSRFHYQIDAPGRMTSNPDGTASFIGPSERLEIRVVQGSAASDPSALASQDIKSLAAGAAAFHQFSNPAKLTLNGLKVTRFAYAWNAGTSTVTGKAIQLTSVRYYVSKDAATLAVVTYGIVSNQFDPQGADDVVSTFQWR
jgi:hypothetical protein